MLWHPSKAKAKLGWVREITLAELVAEIVVTGYGSAQHDSLVTETGFLAFDHRE